MNKLILLNKIKELYQRDNINIIKWMKEEFKEDTNNLADILISYDFQAGTYIQDYLADRHFRDKYLERLAFIIEELKPKCNSILECGCGEATILVPLINLLRTEVERICGIDISWSRIKYGKKFASEYLIHGGG